MDIYKFGTRCPFQAPGDVRDALHCHLGYLNAFRAIKLGFPDVWYKTDNVSKAVSPVF